MRKLIFIPYQDAYDYSITRIMTREYSMLSVLMESGYFDEIVCIGKPRTLLDRNAYVQENPFPESSREYIVKKYLDSAVKIRYETFLSVNQALTKRGWWVSGYEKTFGLIKNENLSNCFVYCNSPFAWKLLKRLKDNGALIFFDMMDNFARHPSLRESEKEKAFKGYQEVFEISDFSSCNSEQTQLFCKNKLKRDVNLIKNGVFHFDCSKETSSTGTVYSEEFTEIRRSYKNIVGYIGKLGKRIDVNLIKALAEGCSNTAFVMIGPMLRDQKNEELSMTLKSYNNLFYLPPVPSSDVMSLLKEFDILMIPHSVGENENGGDPLKLYQYLDIGKPVISTDIIGVREFEDIIKISNIESEWIDFITSEEWLKFTMYTAPESIYWKSRCEKLLEYLNKNM